MNINCSFQNDFITRRQQNRVFSLNSNFLLPPFLLLCSKHDFATDKFIIHSEIQNKSLSSLSRSSFIAEKSWKIRKSTNKHMSFGEMGNVASIPESLENCLGKFHSVTTHVLMKLVIKRNKSSFSPVDSWKSRPRSSRWSLNISSYSACF